MDWKTSLDWYCSGNILDKEDIELLEIHYQHVVSRMELNESQEELAPKHICNQIDIPEGSSWTTAVAVVLDRLSPVKTGKTRNSVIDLLSGK